MAAALFAGNRNDDAWREANVALQTDPGNPVSRFIRGEINLQRGRVDQALEDFRAAVATDSLHAGATLRIAMIDLELARGRPEVIDEAVAMAQRASRLAESEDPDLHRQALDVLARAEAARQSR
jgi:predicted Zn-dependent protease